MKTERGAMQWYMVFLGMGLIFFFGGVGAHLAGERELSDAALVMTCVSCLACVGLIIRAQIVLRREREEADE